MKIRGRELFMSSFRSDVSQQIRHSLAEFSIFPVSDDGLGHLNDKARWLLDYALSKGQGKRLPMRQDLSPADMKEILPDVLILEPQVEADGRLTDILVRLAGTNIATFYGQVSGKSLRELSDPMAAERGFEGVVETLRRREPVVGVSVKLNDNLPYFQVTVLFIPLVGENGEISQIFVHVMIEPEKNHS